MFWEFFSQTNDATEIQEGVYLPTPKLEEYTQELEDFLDGEIDKVEQYRRGG